MEQMMKGQNIEKKSKKENKKDSKKQQATTKFSLDLSKLSQASLSKYTTYFNLGDPYMNKEERNQKITNHFDNQFHVDASSIIDEILELKRRTPESKRRVSRTPKSLFEF